MHRLTAAVVALLAFLTLSACGETVDDPLANGSGTAAPSVSDTTAVSYSNCDEAEAAGAAPLRRGDPGYSSNLDRDDDGIACDQAATDAIDAADPYDAYLQLAAGIPDAPDISRDDAQARAMLGCGSTWAPDTVDAALQEAYAALIEEWASQGLCG